MVNKMFVILLRIKASNEEKLGHREEIIQYLKNEPKIIKQIKKELGIRKRDIRVYIHRINNAHKKK